MRRVWNRGAILADVVAAAFILSIGLLAAAGLFIQIGQAGQVLGRQEQAACFAADGMERLRHAGSEEWSPAKLAGAARPEWLEKDGVQFERTVTLHERGDLDSTGHLLEAEVRVSWVEKNGMRHIAMVTYFAVDTGLDDLR
jgi:hypothetical protein